jgi:GTPase
MHVLSTMSQRQRRDKIEASAVERISPESDEGNKEYKLKLIRSGEVAIEHIATQMRYRLDEGHGEALYTVGVTDSGGVVGLTAEEYKVTKEILDQVAKKNNYTLTCVSEHKVDENKTMYEFLVREKNHNKYIDIRVACAGNVDAGKCESKNTKVILYSGQIKNIQDINTKDILMGDDGTQRKVLQTTKGFGQMYKIVPTNGEAFTVNKNHILCFKSSINNYVHFDEQHKRYSVHCFVWENSLPKVTTVFFPLQSESRKFYHVGTKFYDTLEKAEECANNYLATLKCIKYQDVIELSLEQYVNLDKSTQEVLKLYRVVVNYPEKDVPADGKPWELSGDVSLTSIKDITIEPDQEYYGFELEGNGRYLHEDFTVTHNSSLLGVLLTGQNDDGRGAARLNVFNFQHEVKTGRTSSVAQHILGFNDSGEPVHYTDNLGYRKTWPEIVRQSSKIVTFFDLCGHERYLKTTILGLTSQFPDLTFILVGGNMGMTKMTKEHIFLCLSLHIPFVIVVTKIDICKDRQQVLADTVKEVKTLLSAPGVRRIPYDIKTDEDILLCAKNIHSLSTVPMFYISNVTGEGIPLLRNFLNFYGKRPKSSEQLVNKVEMHVDQTFQVAGVGTVLGGQLVQGKIRIGDKLIVGPNNNVYTTVQVRSIQCKRVPVEEVESGCYVCIGIKKPDSLVVRRGHVVLSTVDRPIQVGEFEADIAVLRSHSTTIKLGYEPVVHTCSIRQTARILAITNKQCGRGQTDSDNVLRTGDRATVKFQFCYKPEFIRKGFRLLLCEGSVKIIGKITGTTEETIKVE